MKSDELLDAIGDLPDATVEQTENLRRGFRTPLWVRVTAAAACACLTVAAVGITVTRRGSTEPPVSGDISESESAAPTETTQPTQATKVTAVTKSPGSDAACVKILALPQYATKKMMYKPAYVDGMAAFYKKVTKAFLQGKSGENRVCSPLNMYFALSMLTEITDGNSRGQLLKLLGTNDLPTLRERCAALWDLHYRDGDNKDTLLLANSLWMANGISYRQAPLDRLATDHHAAAFQGDMGSAGYDRALQEWINGMTGGLLQEAASDLHMDAATVLTLASTVLLRDQWEAPFRSQFTKDGTFHAAGGDVTCPFMHHNYQTHCQRGKNYLAVNMPFASNKGGMWLILPDEGVSVDTLIDAGTPVAVSDIEQISEYAMVHLSVPKFDVCADLDLREGLRTLGVTDVFDGAKADFSPLTDDGAVLGSVKHAARVAADEEGVTAAAYTVEQLAGATLPRNEYTFTADRPFLFAVTGIGSSLLFAGVVEKPLD